MPSKNRKRNNRNRNTDYDFNEDDKKKINSIVTKKSMVIIFNIFFMISGIGLVVFGTYTIKTKHEYISLLTSALYQTSTYLLLISGSVIIITGILGIIGAWLGNKKILIAYVILLSIILISEVLAGVLAIAYRAKLKDNLKQDLDMLIKEQYNKPGYETKTQALDSLQTKFKCCGATDFNDWKTSYYIQNHTDSTINDNNNNNIKRNLVAESCCKTPSHLCAVSDHPSNINYNGCVDALENSIKDYILILGIVGCSACIIQALGILFTILLINELKKCNIYTQVKTNNDY